MSYEALRAAALNYAPCRYENSRLVFRGPLRRLDVPYVAVIGGTETYGKFIERPFPDLLDAAIGVDCVNFGIANAGVDVFSNDVFLWDASNGALVTVLQVVGAQNLSNRYYTVHPRRNDRFLKASDLLASLYPEVDFSEFHFTRHLLSALYTVSSARFVLVQRELQTAWTARMQQLLRRFQGQVVLLWMADHPPSKEHAGLIDPATASDPLFVTQPMLDALMDAVTRYEEVVASRASLRAGTDGMVFDEMDVLAAQRLLGAKAHEEAARVLSPTLQALMNEKGRD